MSFSNAFRRTPIQTSVPPPSQSVSRRTTSLIGQAIQATVAQLQTQTSTTSQSSQNLSSNSQRPSDGPNRFRIYFDIKEETIDNKGNVSLTSVPR